MNIKINQIKMHMSEEYINKIVICEEFLRNDELKKASEIIKNTNWMFDTKNNEDHATPFWKMDLKHEEFFSIYVKELIEKHFAKKFVVKELYANGQTFGQDSIYHNEIDNGKQFVFCLYFTHIKKEDVDYAGGYIYFKIPDEKYKICFEPLFNRGMFFPASYLRKANSFGRFFMDMRVSVCWKLEEV